MIVYLKPAAALAQDNLERAKVEIERVIGFRGKVVDTKVEGNRIAVIVEINPKWDLPNAEKVSNLSEWIRAKTRKVFKVKLIR